MYDAIILAGGQARRLDGAAKPQLTVGGVRLLDLALAAVADAEAVVVAGPRQPVAATAVEIAKLQWCREDPPGGGPVAAVAAAVALTRAPVVVLLAADQPDIAPAVPLLVAAVPRGGLAHLVDQHGRPNHLAAAWDRRALVAALEALDTPVDASMRTLASGTHTASVADTGGWGLDCDTPADLARARAGHEADGTTAQVTQVTRSSPA